MCCSARRECPLTRSASPRSSAESLFIPSPSAVPYRCHLSHLSLPSLTDSLSDIPWPKSETHRVRSSVALRSRNLGLAPHQLGPGLSFPANRARGRIICLTKQELLHFDTSDDYSYKDFFDSQRSRTRIDHIDIIGAAGRLHPGCSDPVRSQSPW